MRASVMIAAALAIAVPALARPAPPAETGPACFERIRKLAGDWVTVGDPKETVVLRYRVTAGGSAVEETVMPGQPHEMVTLYHLDGRTLMLTHYCAAGNQPRMKATPESTAARIEFRCAGGTNMKSHDDMHMHHALMVLTGPDRMVSTWTAADKGKKGHEARFDVRRK